MQIYLCFQLALPHSVSYFFFFYQLSLLCLCTQFLMLFHLTEMRLSRSQIVNFPTWIPDCDFHSSAFLDLFISSGELVFVLQWLSLHWEILILWLSQFLLTSHQPQNGMPRFTVELMTILLLMWTDVPWQGIFRLSASAAADEFVSGFRWEWMNISLIVNMRSSLTHFGGFQLFVLWP